MVEFFLTFVNIGRRGGIAFANEMTTDQKAIFELFKILLVPTSN